MIHPVHLENSGLGFLAFFGLLVQMFTEITLKALFKDPNFMTPHSWWLMTGYVVAATYCILLHVLLKWRDSRLGYEEPGARHKLARVPIRYWSIFYIVIGLLRVSAAA